MGKAGTEWRMAQQELRVALVGWGAIARRVAALLAERAAPVRIVAVGVHRPEITRFSLPSSARLILAPKDLAAIPVDLVVEAAGRAAVGPWGVAVLERGVDFAVASTSALTNPLLLERLVGLARSNRAQVLIPPGALGGIDALAAAARLGLREVRHEIIKPAHAWAGTAAADLCDLDALTGPVTFFEGTARAAADAYPQNANATVITALAGIGLDQTTVALTADPAATLNSHVLRVRGDFGAFEMRLENQPLATNPKSSEMTALSLVRLIENRAAPLVI
jgi:aspartate dehydrogenase